MRLLFGVLTIFALAGPAAGKVPQRVLPVEVVAAGTPAGGVAQIRVVLTAPLRLAGGTLTMDLDPNVFGPVAAVDVFSATGDQMGVASLRDRHVEVTFKSVTGGVGQLPGMPVMAVRAPVLAEAKAGDVGLIAVKGTETAWKDVDGNQYVVEGRTARMKVGGSLSVDSVRPGGGPLAERALVRVEGRGFTPATKVSMDGVVVRRVTVEGSQALQVELGASAELTGKRLVVRNEGGEEADFYCALTGGTAQGDAGERVQAILPLMTYAGASVGAGGAWLMIQNPTQGPVEVVAVTSVWRMSSGGTTYGSSRLSLGAGETVTWYPRVAIPSTTISNWLFSETPLRMLLLGGVGQYRPGVLNWEGYPAAVNPVTPTLSRRWVGNRPVCQVNYSDLSYGPACFSWQAGTEMPKPLDFQVSAMVPTEYTVALTGGEGWLSGSALAGTACLMGSTTCSTVRLSVDPRGLAAGEYEAGITITPSSPLLKPWTEKLQLKVAASLISVDRASLQFWYGERGEAVAPVGLQVRGSAGAAPFRVRVTNTADGAPWLKVWPREGVAPATVTVAVDPTALPEGRDSGWAVIAIDGEANGVTQQVWLERRMAPQPRALSANVRGQINAPLVMWVKAGSVAPATATFQVNPVAPDVVETEAEEGGRWLSASARGNEVTVAVDASGLKTGLYHGMVKVASTSPLGYLPVSVRVDVGVWAEAPELGVTPAALELTARSGLGGGAMEALDVRSGGVAVECTGTATTEDGNGWLRVQPPGYVLGYGQLNVAASTKDLPPGEYTGEVQVTAPPGVAKAVAVPVRLRVTAAAPGWMGDWPAVAASVVNAASQKVGAVSAGAVLSIHGVNLGPSPAAVAEVDASGEVGTELAGVRVWMGGVAARVVSAGPTRVEAVALNELEEGSAEVVLEYQGVQALAGGVAVAPASPGIYTVDGSGQGQAKAFGEDGAANGVESPAREGSTVGIWVTGLGRVGEAGVAVTIGGKEAKVVGVARAAGQVAGVVEVRAMTPAGVPPGVAVPVEVRAGMARSQEGVTLVVR